jgi:hypothetical protein
VGLPEEKPLFPNNSQSRSSSETAPRRKRLLQTGSFSGESKQNVVPPTYHADNSPGHLPFPTPNQEWEDSRNPPHQLLGTGLRRKRLGSPNQFLHSM